MKTSHASSFRMALAVVPLALGVLCAQAAVVTYEITNLNGTPVSPTVVLNPSVTPRHTLLGALNMAASGSPAPNRTINGVTFEPAAVVAIGSKTFSSSLEIAWNNPLGDPSSNQSRTTNTFFDTRYGTGDFREVMREIMQSNPSSAFSLTLSGLQAGMMYQVQFLIDDFARQSQNLSMSIGATGTDSGSTGSFTFGQNGGKSVLAHFTTGAGQTSINFSVAAPADSRAVLAGLIVTEIDAIPEPSTTMLCFVGIGIFLLRRRLNRHC